MSTKQMTNKADDKCKADVHKADDKRAAVAHKADDKHTAEVHKADDKLTCPREISKVFVLQGYQAQG
jgi:hypothetical protein